MLALDDTTAAAAAAADDDGGGGDHDEPLMWFDVKLFLSPRRLWLVPNVWSSRFTSTHSSRALFTDTVVWRRPNCHHMVCIGMQVGVVWGGLWVGEVVVVAYTLLIAQLFHSAKTREPKKHDGCCCN